jgi:hypothetical protein
MRFSTGTRPASRSSTSLRCRSAQLQRKRPAVSVHRGASDPSLSTWADGIFGKDRDKGYDSNANRRELRKRRILPVISRKASPNIKGLGKLRYVVEQTVALLHQFKRLAIRWERRTELHDAFVSLTCSLICWRRLKKANS